MSTIAVIGGHGKVGLLLSRSLTSSGHTVRSVIRDPDQADEVASTGAQPVVADIETSSAAELAAAIGAADAVVFTAGNGGKGGPERTEAVDHQGALKAMEAAMRLGTDRFVVVSFLGADDPTAGGRPGMIPYQRAKQAADDAVRASDLTWTIVRPGGLNDGVSDGVTIEPGITEGTTSRANVAELVAALVTDHPAPRQVLNVIDGPTPILDALERLEE
jgi:uncharacterized protein YbjT (DUF2867 family)